MFNRRSLIAAAALGAVLFAAPPGIAQDKSIVVASTTSTQDSGLFEYLLPLVQGQDRHHREGGGAGHRQGARHRPRAATPTSCSCTPRRRKRNSSPKATA